MPKRLLRDWTDSDAFDGISANAERLFTRLIMKADDYGRFYAEARRVRAACFPLNPDLRSSDIDGWLSELSSDSRRLIWRYKVGTRELLLIPKFGQRLKNSVPKFPPPNEIDVPEWVSSTMSREPPGVSGKFPLEAETEAHSEAHSESEVGPTEISLRCARWIQAQRMLLPPSPLTIGKLALMSERHGWDTATAAVLEAAEKKKGEPFSYAEATLAKRAASANGEHQPIKSTIPDRVVRRE